ncbi:hypothetical protein INF26_00020 [Olsenella sp. DSM 107455]|uniref:Uncharacterized protein n=1 Tax=Thermophilibacter gallinarum TaxID=2779357 RepID=A0ABR9QQ98_9ACTN|nr:hypothetical protein [Thermophilibacter gallinarum]
MGARRDRRERRRWPWVLAAVAVAGALVAAAGPAVAGALREQGAASVRDAVLRAAAQCCAIEGSYPHTLRHLEQHYGLTVNHDDYVVIYEAYASNVTPSVVVTPR